jgi:hypothetical protein
MKPLKPSLVVVTWDGKSDPLEYIYQDTTIVPEQFDLLLFDYSGKDNSALAQNSVGGTTNFRYLSFATECKGQIITHLYNYILNHNLSNNYQYIGIFDDDHLISVSDINKLLFIAATEKLDVFQPSLSQDSYYDNRQFINKPGYIILQAPWVEVMCPFYSMDIFMAFVPYCTNNISGTGLDVYLVPTIQYILGKNNTAVIHAVQIKHCRPVRTGERVFSNQKTSVQEIQEMQQISIQLLKDKGQINGSDPNYIRLMEILSHTRNGDISWVDKIKRIPLLLKNIYRALVDASYR